MSDKNINSTIFAKEVSSLKGKNMIAVVSGHRNSGKTWFSINLAQALSLFKQKVILFDGDYGLNNSKAQLGLYDINDLDKVIYGNSSLNQVIYNYDKGRFDIIAGASGSSGLATMSIGRLQIFGDDLNIVAKSYDKMIVDISSGLSNPAKVMSGMCQSIIVVCNDDPQSIIRNYSLIKIISSHHPDTDINIVINQANNIEEGQRTYQTLNKACNEFLKNKQKLLGIIRQDARVRDSIRNQSTIISRYPQSEAAQDIIAIAQRILKNEQYN